MQCIVCKSNINNLAIKNFSLHKEKPQWCLKCKSKYLPAMHLAKIPIKNYTIWHFYVTENNITPSAYNGLNQYFKPYYLLAAYYQRVVLVFDTIPSDKMLLNSIDNLLMGDLIMITYDYGKEILDEI